MAFQVRQLTLSINGMNESVFSYASVQEADIRLSIDINRGPAWNRLNETDKIKHLAAASWRVDTAFVYRGEKTDSDQPLEWPRTGVTLNNRPVANMNVPDDIHEATVLFAGSVADNAQHLQIRVTNRTSNVEEEQIGRIRRKYFSPIHIITTEDTRAVRDEDVLPLLQRYAAAQTSVAELIPSGFDQGLGGFIDATDYARC